MILHVPVLLGMIASASLAVYFRDLINSVIALGVFSFLLSIEFYLLQAPDVAIAEAGVGAGLTTAIFVLAIQRTRRIEEVTEL